jgi:hypothetical protein
MSQSRMAIDGMIVVSRPQRPDDAAELNLVF